MYNYENKTCIKSHITFQEETRIVELTCENLLPKDVANLIKPSVDLPKKLYEETEGIVSCTKLIIVLARGLMVDVS